MIVHFLLQKISKEQTPRHVEIVQVTLDEEVTSGIEQRLFAKFQSKKKKKEKENEEISKQRKVCKTPFFSKNHTVSLLVLLELYPQLISVTSL